MAIPQHLLAGAFLFAVVGGMLAAPSGSYCPDDDAELVYPYWSLCGTGATYGQSYYIVSAYSSEGGLVGEWDESNQTYYMRLAESYSSFVILPVDSEQSGTAIRQNVTVRIALSTLDYALNWRNEGVDDWFLVQESCSSEGCASDGAYFIITEYTGTTMLPCPRIYGARCKIYYLSSAPGTYYGGLKRYEEEGAVYVTLGDEGSEGDLPLVIRAVTAEGDVAGLRSVVG